MDEPLRGVGRTALAVARVRAAEHRRADRILTDPFAEAFAAAGPPAAPVRGGPARDLMVLQVIVRTRFYDDYLRAATAAGIRQVVLLAAGLDTRAFRLDWPDGTRLFEVDLPDVLDFKDAALAGAEPRCERTTVAADLRDDWARRLRAAGFDPSRRTAWLVEGLLIYLLPGDAAALLGGIGAESVPGGRLAAEDGAGTAWLLEHARRNPDQFRAGPLWNGGLGEATASWLEEHGWRTERHALTDVAASYGRPAPEGTRSGFLTAERLS
ncbi:SAM-dependent methyltransferase [Actinomadura logoneensis]|uniref:S-adenosyl-L-methionine-dependent methyltransferase n=1 Tax=Actinomadura logoneensis TaxID=2293572 RepID=A0A372JM57_9ACTN|nr:SAM-dependent methyltransferase [Actinomadura logoneensis]RFU40874.1 SAM-dependent methyltransferase [Actinomadura logoneensis]